MTEQDIKKLSRLDLLQMLIEQGKENEVLKADAEKAVNELKLSEEKLQLTREELERCGAKVEKLKEELKSSDNKGAEKLQNTLDELARCGARVEQLKEEIKVADQEILRLNEELKQEKENSEAKIKKLKDPEAIKDHIVEINQSFEEADEYLDKFQGKYEDILKNMSNQYYKLEKELEKQKGITADLVKEKQTLTVSLAAFKRNLEMYSESYPEFKDVLELMAEQGNLL